MRAIRSWWSRASAEDLRLAGLMLVFQIFSVLYQTAMTQQFAASVTRFRAGLHIVFGLVHILYAAGMYLAYLAFRGEFRMGRLQALLVATGATLAASLLLCLRLNVEVASASYFLPATIASIAVSLTLFGMIYSALLTWFHRRHRRSLGGLVAVSLAGLIAGFAFAAPLTIHIGNNLLVAAMALASVSMAFGRRGLAAAGVVAVAALAFPGLDRSIERLRDVEGRFKAHSYEQYLTRADVQRMTPVLDAWSPYAKINLFEVPGTSKLAGVYNYYITWIFDGQPDRRRLQLYGFVGPEDRVMVIAIGGGWPLLALPQADRKKIVGVELDPVVVDYFGNRQPERNARLFKDIELVRAEGRAALETLKGPFDQVIIDLPGSPATQKENPIEFEVYTLTREAFERAFELLGEEGVLVAYLLPHQAGPAYATLKASGVYFRTVFTPLVFERNQLGNPMSNEAFAMYASRDRQKVDAIVDRILASSPGEGERVTTVPPDRLATLEKYEPATDDQPYSQFRAWARGQLHSPRGSAFVSALKLIGGAVGATLLLALGVVTVGARGRRRLDLAYFLFIGIGFVLLQLHLYARLRSYFGDPTQTVLLATLLLFAASSLGGLLANRFEQVTGAKRWIAVAVVLALLGLTYAGIGLLPFGSPSLLVKLLAAAVVIVPFGVASGVFFPLGLMRLDGRSLGWGLTLDGAGTFVGFVLFYVLAWTHGIASTIWPVLVCYGLAALLAARSAPAESAQPGEG